MINSYVILIKVLILFFGILNKIFLKQTVFEPFFIYFEILLLLSNNYILLCDNCLDLIEFVINVLLKMIYSHTVKIRCKPFHV